VEVQGSKQAIHSVVFHPDGSRVFFSSHDGSVQSWEGKPNTKPVEIGKHDGPATFLAASPDKVHIVSISTDGTARIWDIGAKKPHVVSTIQHDGPVNHAAFSPDGTLVATGSADRMARIIRVDGKEPPFVLPGHTQAITRVAFHPNGPFLATSSQDGTARIFRIESDASFVLRGHDAAVRTIAWNHKGTMLVTAAGDGTDRSPDETARVWNGAVVQSIGYGGQGALVDHSVEMDGMKTSIVVVHGDEVVRVFHRERGNRPTVVLPSTGGWVASASLSEDGQLVATASFDKLVRVFRVDKPNDPIVLSGHEAEVRFVAFSRDGTRVLSGGDDSNAFVFSIDGKTPPVKLAGHRDWLTAGAWSPDGKRVATASFDRTARVWNVDGSGAPLELAGHRAEILAVAFFPDGEQIVTASADFTARIWKPGKEPRILQHDGAVSRVAVSLDGKFVATYATDHLIRIWRVDSTESPIELEAATVVHLLTFENDGQQLIAIDIEGGVHVWMIDPAALRDRIVKANADCLPKSIRMLHLGESTTVAESRYADCKKKPYEMPWINPVESALLAVDVRAAEGSGAFRIMEIPTLKELGADMVRVKVVVLPTDADVEIDGIATARRQGVIEFVGKLGQTRKIRVQRGAKHRSFDINIGAGGVSPTRVDLNDKLAGSGRPGSTDKPLKTKADPLRPDTME
jgi:WD40 repeat protein